MIFFGNKIKSFKTKFSNLDSFSSVGKVEDLILTVDEKVSRSDFKRAIKKYKRKYNNLIIKNEENLFEDNKEDKSLFKRIFNFF